MFYFLGIVIVMLFVCANLRYGKRNIMTTKKGTLTSEKIFMFGVFAILFLILALQSVESNSDMLNYRNSYYEFIHCSTRYALTVISQSKDPAYHLVAYGMQKLGLGFYGWHACIALFYIVSLFVLIERYSSNVYISIIVALTLGSYSFAFSGLRQIIAISFVMFAFKFIVEKKIPKFVLLVLVASLFHGTAMIFLLAYPLYHLTLKKRNIIGLIAIAVIAIINAERIMKLYLSFTGMEENYSDYYDREVSLSLSGAIISVSIFLFCLIVIYTGKGEARHKGLCNMALVSLSFDILSALMFAELFRVGMYFSVFNIILIAEACSFDSKKNKMFSRIKVLVVTLLMVVYYFVASSVNLIDYVSVFQGVLW